MNESKKRDWIDVHEGVKRILQVSAAEMGRSENWQERMKVSVLDSARDRLASRENLNRKP